jgi:ABC-type glycerol-3-phosphate transport system permease component
MTTRQGRASRVARLVVLMLALLWLVPAAGILITSVRTPDAVNNSGWWTVFRLPPDFSQFSFASYRQAFYGSLHLTGTYAAVYLTHIGLLVWNDLLIALLYLGEGDRQVVTVTLGGLIGGNQALGWQVVTGGAIITMAVPVLVFMTLQRYFVRGLAAGSVGG